MDIAFFSLLFLKLKYSRSSPVSVYNLNYEVMDMEIVFYYVDFLTCVYSRTAALVYYRIQHNYKHLNGTFPKSLESSNII